MNRPVVAIALLATGCGGKSRPAEPAPPAERSVEAVVSDWIDLEIEAVTAILGAGSCDESAVAMRRWLDEHSARVNAVKAELVRLPPEAIDRTMRLQMAVADTEAMDAELGALIDECSDDDEFMDSTGAMLAVFDLPDPPRGQEPEAARTLDDAMGAWKEHVRDLAYSLLAVSTCPERTEVLREWIGQNRDAITAVTKEILGHPASERAARRDAHFSDEDSQEWTTRSRSAPPTPRSPPRSTR